MSVNATAYVWDLNIPRTEKLILLAYAWYANSEGGSIFPAVGSVARKAGVSERTVQRITHTLRRKGLLVRVRAGTGRSHTNHYRIPLAPAPNNETSGKGGSRTPIPERMSSAVEKGDNPGAERATAASRKGDDSAERAPSAAGKGDAMVSPEPSLTSKDKKSNQKREILNIKPPVFQILTARQLQAIPPGRPNRRAPTTR